MNISTSTNDTIPIKLRLAGNDNKWVEISQPGTYGTEVSATSGNSLWQNTLAHSGIGLTAEPQSDAGRLIMGLKERAPVEIEIEFENRQLSRYKAFRILDFQAFDTNYLRVYEDGKPMYTLLYPVQKALDNIFKNEDHDLVLQARIERDGNPVWGTRFAIFIANGTQ